MSCLLLGLTDEQDTMTIFLGDSLQDSPPPDSSAIANTNEAEEAGLSVAFIRPISAPSFLLELRSILYLRNIFVERRLTGLWRLN